MRTNSGRLFAAVLAALGVSVLSACFKKSTTEPEGGSPPDSLAISVSSAGASAIRVVWSEAAGETLLKAADGQGTGPSAVAEPLS